MEHKYQPLKSNDEPTLESLTLYQQNGQNRPPSRWKAILYSIILLLSLLGNAAFYLHIENAPRASVARDRSPYAKLPRDFQTTYHRAADYISRNRTVADAAWSRIDINDGTVAIPDTVAAALSLPKTQRFPWDDSKGLYMAASYHSLHCLRTIRKAIFETHDGLPLSMHFAHLVHCLDDLRQEILCNADDTPLWTGAAAKGLPGLGQSRMCRDWSRLQDWLRQYNACYDHHGNDIPGYPEIDHFRNCPPESPYLETSQKGTEVERR